MKLKFRVCALALVLILLAGGCGLSQENFVPTTVLGDTLFDSGLLPIRMGDRWGYVNKTGEVQILPVYHQARAFSENLAAVFSGTAWGYLNTEGEMKLEAQYDEAGDFSMGRAAVRQGEKWGYIDAKGKMKIEPQFEEAGKFTLDGVAVVKKDGKYGLINNAGKFVVQPEYDEMGPFAYGYAAVRMGDAWNFVDLGGKRLLDTSVEEVGNFSYNGLAAVKLGGLWGYVNQKGDIAIDWQFKDVQGFSVNNLAAVTMGDGWGYVNKDGRLVIPPQFDSAMPFAQGVAVVEQDGKFGLIDAAGEFVAKPVYDAMSGFMNSDRIRVEKDGEAGYLNGNGVDVIALGFAESCANYFYDDGFTVVKAGGKYGVINFAGQYVINPRFDEIGFANYEM